MMGEPVIMEPLIIRKEIEVDASIETVWRSVATSAGLRRWYKADTIVLDPRVGGRYEEHAVYEGQPHHVVGEVLVYDPPRTFVHTYRAQRRDGTYWPVDTIVTISLTVAGSRTSVVVEHSGFERLPMEYARRAFETYDAGWGVASERLPEVVRDGTGQLEAYVVHREVEIDAPPVRVWPFVATASGYGQWSCAVADKYEVTLEERVGGRYEEHGAIGNDAWTNIGEILTYDPPRRLMFTLQTRRRDGSVSPVTTVTISLVDLGGRTRLTLEHDLQSVEPERRETKFRGFEVGWAHALEELRMIVESGVAAQPEGVAPLAVHKRIEIDAPPDRVWPYVATAEGCRKWFCTVAEQYDLVLEPKVGGRYEQRMMVKGTLYHSIGAVLAYDAPRRLIFTARPVSSNSVPSLPTTVTIVLTDLGDRTGVSVTERGFELLPEAECKRVFGSSDQGWSAAMEDLFAILARDLLFALGHLLIYQSVEIEAPADRVWWFLATEEGRRESDQRVGYPADHYEREVFEAREGGRWESAGRSAHSGDPYRQFGRILTYEPPRLLVMTLQEDGWPTETTVTYRLTEYFGKTRVTLIHSGFEKLPPERREMTRKAYEIGRYKSLDRLRALVEGEETQIHRPLFVRKEIEITAPIGRVWHFVGTQEGSLARHRAESVPRRFEYRDEILEERVGGRYELSGIYEGTPFRISGRVLAYDPPHLLALSWREDGWPVDTLVRFRLAESDGRTHVTVVHNGFEHLPTEYRERAQREYETGRQRGLELLKALLERDEPDSSSGSWTIRREIEIEAPAASVWPFVATRAGLEHWWKSTRRLVLEEREGGRFELVVEFDGRLYTIVGRVLVYNPPRRFAISWREVGGEAGEWPAETEVSFILEVRGDRTRVTVEHSGFERLPRPIREQMLRSYEQGWTQEEMERLRDLVLEEMR